MASPSEADLVGLAAAAYDAALDASLWPGVMERLRVAFGALSANVSAYDLARMQGFVLNAGSDPTMTESYVAHYVKMDPVVPLLTRSGAAGRSYDRAALLPDAALVRSEYYADWLRPQGIWHGLFAVAFRSETVSSMITLCRGQRQDGFDSHVTAALETLTPHLARAVRTTCRLAAAEARGNGVEGLLARLRDGALLLDADGAVVYANPAAEALLRGGDGLATAQGRLRAVRDDAALRRAVAAAAAGSSEMLAVARPSGQAPLAVTVQPALAGRLSASDPWRIAPVPAALVFVVEPDRDCGGTATARRALRTLYGLTGAETAAAEAVAKGQGVAEAAEALGVAPTTLRWHLRNVFDKIGISRQAELVRLVERLSVP